jgi:hypothetical protein
VVTSGGSSLRIGGHTESVKEKGHPLQNEGRRLREILIPIVVVLLVGAIFFLPLSPVISGGFSIKSTSFGPQTQVGITLVPASYTRDTVFNSYPAGSGSIFLPVRPSELGNYKVTIQVSYGGASFLTQDFDKIGDGTYGFKVRYIWQQESANVPYIITITVSGEGVQTVSTSFQVYPS